MATNPVVATRRRGRPRKVKEEPKHDPYFDDIIGGETEPDDASGTPAELKQGLDLALVYGGVSAAWLDHVFGMDKNTIKKKLAKCPVATMKKATPHYAIKEAAAYLIPPKVDLLSYIKSLRPQDLPPVLSDAYWAAQLKRQKWEVNAGELWHTADVMEVFGELAKTLKTTIQLWTDELERIHGLSDEQRKSLTQMSDGLLLEIHHILVTAPSRQNTLSSAEDPEIGGADGI